jgi:toxin YoeB
MLKSVRKEFHLRKPVRSLEFDPAAFEDLAWWIEQDRQKALRIINLIKDVQRDPFKGIGNQNR